VASGVTARGAATEYAEETDEEPLEEEYHEAGPDEDED